MTPNLPHEPLDEEERALAAQLTRDALPGPGAALDARILAQARAAVRPEPLPVARGWVRRSWVGVSAMAACVALAIGVVRILPERRDTATAAAAAAAPVPEDASVAVMRVPATANASAPAPEAAPDFAELPNAPEAARVARAAPARTAPPPVRAAEQGRPVRTCALPPAPGSVASTAHKEIPPAASVRAAAVVAAAPPSAVLAEQASRADADEVMTQTSAAPQAVADTHADVANAKTVAAPSHNAQGAQVSRQPVDPWAEVRRLQARGEHAQARAALKAVQAAHPQLHVPDDLAALLKP